MADMPPARKFLFEHTFDAAAAPRAPERKPVMLKPEQVDALKKEAFDAGFAAGQKAGADEHARHMAAILTRVEERVAQMVGNMQTLIQENDVKIRTMVLAIARKILPSFTAKHGLGEIQSMLSEVITEMVHEPRLVVRTHESEFDFIDGKINEIIVQKAYAGKVVVLADPDIASGDCRVEWADGGIERNTATTLQDVEKIVRPADGSAPLSP